MFEETDVLYETNNILVERIGVCLDLFVQSVVCSLYTFVRS